MAETTVIQTGMREFRQAAELFPEAVTAAMRRAAQATANGILVDARQRLLAQTQGTGRTAAAMHIVELPDKKRFDVRSPSPRGRPANLVFWIEYGTIRQAPRRYMKPAYLAAVAPYERECTTAAALVAARTFAE